MSLNQFINMALAKKVTALEAKEDFTKRVARANNVRFLDVLDRTGRETPQRGDELEQV
jgi:hypothetical protein